ncbi:ALKMO monooxygenase [Balamuthia mandrillaris]
MKGASKPVAAAQATARSRPGKDEPGAGKAKGSHNNKKEEGQVLGRFKNTKQEVAMGPMANVLAGTVMLALHGWFLAFLQSEYEAVQLKEGHKIKDYVAMWSPIFIGSIILEVAWSWYKGSAVYRTNDSVSSMSLGIYSMLFKHLWVGVVTFTPYTYVYQNFALTRRFEDGGMLAWWLMFVCVELGYYWYHRTGHTVHAFWAMHSVHHSSEEYNLSTALRQSTLTSFISWLQFNLLYQFWIHTAAVGKLGPLEWILNTPSQHRVHHGKNEYCIDKNYGGTLCIFDRLFGTFQEELDEVPIAYGTIHPINTWDPIESNIHPWRAIFANIRKVKGFKNKLLCLFNGPGWIPGSQPHAEYPIPPCSTDAMVKYNPALSARAQWYIGVHCLLMVIIFNMALIAESAMPYYWFFLFNGYVVWGLYNLGAISNRKTWAFLMEITRIIVAIPLGCWTVALYLSSFVAEVELFLVMSHPLCIAVYGIVAVSALLLLSCRKELKVAVQKHELGDMDLVQAEKDQALQLQLLHAKRD